MAKKNVAANALTYIFTLVKATFATKADVPTKVSQLANDSGYVTTDANTTYTLRQDSTDGHRLTFEGSDGSSAAIAIPDADTTYSEAVSGGASGLMSGTDKAKLDGIAAGANKTTVDSAMSSSSANPVQNKVVDAALSKKADVASPTLTGTPKAPTAQAGTSDTQIATTAFVSAAVSAAIAGVTQIDIKVVTALPATGVKGTLYFVANGSGEGGNSYDEYVWLPDAAAFEKVGTAEVDLSEYLKESDLTELTNAEIDACWAAA